MASNYSNIGQVADWERQLAALIARNNTNTGSEAATGMQNPRPLSHDSNHQSELSNRSGAATRPVPKVVEDDLSSRIQTKATATVRTMLTPIDRSLDILRGQISSTSGDCKKQQASLESIGTTISSHGRLLKTLQRDQDHLGSRLTATASDVVLLQRRQGEEFGAMMDRVSSAMSHMQSELLSLRSDVKKLREENKSMRQELDSIGISGGGLGSTINDRVKSIVAHAVAIQSAGVEKSLQAQVDLIYNERMKDKYRANNMRETVSNAITLLKRDLKDRFQTAINDGLKQARSNLETSIEQRMATLKVTDEAARRDELTVLIESELTVLIESGLNKERHRIHTDLQEKCRNFASKSEVAQLIREVEERVIETKSTTRMLTDEGYDASLLDKYADTEDRLNELEQQHQHQQLIESVPTIDDYGAMQSQYNQPLLDLSSSITHECEERKSDIASINVKLQMIQTREQQAAAGSEAEVESSSALSVENIKPPAPPSHQQQQAGDHLQGTAELYLQYIANTDAAATLSAVDEDSSSQAELSIPTLDSSSDAADAIESEPAVVAELQNKFKHTRSNDVTVGDGGSVAGSVQACDVIEEVVGEHATS